MSQNTKKNVAIAAGIIATSLLAGCASGNLQAASTPDSTSPQKSQTAERTTTAPTEKPSTVENNEVADDATSVVPDIAASIPESFTPNFIPTVEVPTFRVTPQVQAPRPTVVDTILKPILKPSVDVPVKPVEPTKPSDSVDPVAPVEPETPVNPVDPVKPEPTDPTVENPTTPDTEDPADPGTVDPGETDPITPVEPEPENPTEPITPVEPTDPVEPVDPTEPGTDPVDPSEPGTDPIVPVDPEVPGETDPTDPTPVDPTVPVEPVDPTTPVEPTDPTTEEPGSGTEEPGETTDSPELIAARQAVIDAQGRLSRAQVVLAHATAFRETAASNRDAADAKVEAAQAAVVKAEADLAAATAKVASIDLAPALNAVNEAHQATVVAQGNLAAAKSAETQARAQLTAAQTALADAMKSVSGMDAYMKLSVAEKEKVIATIMGSIINNYRVEAGLNPLPISDARNLRSEAWSDKLAADGKLSHDSNRHTADGASYENVLYNWANLSKNDPFEVANTLVKQWVASKGHHLGLTANDIVGQSIGLHYVSETGQLFATWRGYAYYSTFSAAEGYMPSDYDVISGKTAATNGVHYTGIDSAGNVTTTGNRLSSKYDYSDAAKEGAPVAISASSGDTTAEKAAVASAQAAVDKAAADTQAATQKVADANKTEAAATANLNAQQEAQAAAQAEVATAEATVSAAQENLTVAETAAAEAAEDLAQATLAEGQAGAEVVAAQENLASAEAAVAELEAAANTPAPAETSETPVVDEVPAPEAPVADEAPATEIIEDVALPE